MKIPQKTSLPTHEWLAVLVIVLFMAILTIVAAMNNRSPVALKGNPSDWTSKYIEVAVQGAVEHSGTHVMPKGATIGDLLDMAKPLYNADLRKCKMQALLKNGQKLTIPNREMIKLIIKGEVESPGIVSVPRGTRYSDLPSHLKLTNRADLNVFQSKKRIKEGELVMIPQQEKCNPNEFEVNN